MPFFAVHNVHMTTDESGTAGVYEVTSLPEFRTFGDELQAGDQTWICVFDGSGNYEVCTATYQIGPARMVRDDLIDTSEALDGAVDWPATGTRDIVGTFPGKAAESIFEPGASNVGWPMQASDYTWNYRTFEASSPGGHLTVDAGRDDGSGGNPRYNDALLDTRFARKDSSQNITGTWDYQAATMNLGILPALFRLTNGGEDVLDILRIGTNDYRLRVAVGGALSVNLAEANYASDWAPRVDVATSTDTGNTVGRVETAPASGTEWAVSVTVPAAGTWNVEVHALLLMHQTTSGSGTWNDIQFELDHEVGGGGFSPVAGFGQMISPHNYGSSSGNRILSASLAYTLEAAASGLHEFRVDLVARNDGIELHTTGVYVHRLQAKAYRVA